jgi:hypothetical protein
MSMVGFPLLLIPLAIYNIIAFLMPSVSFTDTLVKLKLVSGTEWPITLSDVLLALAIVLLLQEVIKGARPGGKYLTDHLLSFVVFGASAAEFVLWPKFGSSTYFLLVLLAMVDFFSGIALRVRRSARAARGSAAHPPSRDVAPDVGPERTSDVVKTPAPAPVAVEPAPVDHATPKVTVSHASEPAPAQTHETSPIVADAPPPVIELPPPAADAEPKISSPEVHSGNSTPPEPEEPRR